MLPARKQEILERQFQLHPCHFQLFGRHFLMRIRHPAMTQLLVETTENCDLKTLS